MLQLSRANEIVRRSQIIEMTNEASAEAMLAWIMPCKEEFGDIQMTNEDFEERSDDPPPLFKMRQVILV